MVGRKNYFQTQKASVKYAYAYERRCLLSNQILEPNHPANFYIFSYIDHYSLYVKIRSYKLAVSEVKAI